MPKKLSEVQIPGSTYELGLTLLAGKKIAEIRGYISGDFGDPTFLMTRVYFEDGSFCEVEGEHDHPYLIECPTSPIEGLSEDTLSSLYREQNHRDGEEEDDDAS